MTGPRTPTHLRPAPGPDPVVKLARTACQHVYQPDLTDFESGNTGCPRCGGWTWIAQLDTATAGGGGAA
jgi:ribosomal protein S27AE